MVSRTPKTIRTAQQVWPKLIRQADLQRISSELMQRIQHLPAGNLRWFVFVLLKILIQNDSKQVIVGSIMRGKTKL